MWTLITTQENGHKRYGCGEYCSVWKLLHNTVVDKSEVQCQVSLEVGTVTCVRIPLAHRERDDGTTGSIQGCISISNHSGLLL